MNYPNTNQISALLGRKITPNYESYLDEEVAALPQYLRLKESRDYNDKQLDLSERTLAENIRQGDLNYELARDQAKAQKKNQNIANLIGAGGLAMNAYSAMDEAGIDLVDSGRKALDAVLPDTAPLDTIEHVGSSGNWAGVNDPYGQGGGVLSQLAQGVNDWVVEPVSGLAEGVGDFVTEKIPQATKYITGDMWSDVSGWVEDLFA